jgi:hypothetical protein
MEKTMLKEWVTVPVLPCVSIEETVAFWEAMGYKTTYLQTSPYQYGVVSRGGASLHLGKVKGMKVEQNYVGCLVMVADAEEVYKEFTGHLKKIVGKVPHTGIPRISRMKPKGTRFTLTDVAGNSVIFITSGEQDQENWEKADDASQSKLQKAMALARRLRDYKNDDEAAGKVLDTALKKLNKEKNTEVAEAIIMRIEIAGYLNDSSRAAECSLLLNNLNLSKNELDMLKRKHTTNQ